MLALLIAILIAAIIAAILVWAVQRFMPGDPAFKGIVCLIIVVIAVVWAVMKAHL